MFTLFLSLIIVSSGLLGAVILYQSMKSYNLHKSRDVSIWSLLFLVWLGYTVVLSTVIITLTVIGYRALG